MEFAWGHSIALLCCDNLLYTIRGAMNVDVVLWFGTLEVSSDLYRSRAIKLVHGSSQSSVYSGDLEMTCMEIAVEANLLAGSYVPLHCSGFPMRPNGYKLQTTSPYEMRHATGYGT